MTTACKTTSGIQRLIKTDGTLSSTQTGFCDIFFTSLKTLKSNLDPNDSPISIDEPDSIVLGHDGRHSRRTIRQYLEDNAATQIKWKTKASITKSDETERTTTEIELSPFIVFFYLQDKYMFLQLLLVDASLIIQLETNQKGILVAIAANPFTFGDLLKELADGPKPILSRSGPKFAEEYRYNKKEK